MDASLISSKGTMKIQTLINIAQSKIAALRYPYCRTKAKISVKKSKIKLVAIAKNEAAYLPEWIYHHLYFGFDKIEIFYNGCTDNTVELAEQFNDERLKFINADPIFSKSKISPQMDIYRPQFAKSRAEGFDHIMFLDIDEFWIPFDLRTTIKEYINSSPYFDSMCFQWANKVDEVVQFARAIMPSISVEPARQLKSIHKTFITPGLMNPHNVIDNSLIRKFSDGNPFEPSNEHHSMAPSASLPNRAFILHRKYRSQVEYVALLGRGRPIGPEKAVSEFKNNREGYYNKNNAQEVAFENTSYQTYNKYMTENLNRSHISHLLDEARTMVVNRYSDVIEAVRNASKDELPVLNRILRHVDIADVQQAFEEYKKRIS